MPDVFISHASADIELARFLHRHLTSEGANVFLAPISLAPAAQLPGWLARFQALTFSGASTDEMQKQISAIAERIKADKAKGLLIGGLLLAGLFAHASKGWQAAIPAEIGVADFRRSRAPSWP